MAIKIYAYIIKMLKCSIYLVCIVLLTSSFTNDLTFENEPYQVQEFVISNEILFLRNILDSIIDDYDNLDFKAGIKIISLRDNQTLYEKNSDLELIPASNMKVITTAAAFDLLGKDFQWTTTFYKSGNINDRILEGDLYVRVTGDPTWNDRFRRNIINETFKGFVNLLKINGIDKVKGNIYIALGSFHDINLGFGWKEENRNHTYSAKPSAIAFNDNSIQLRINPVTSGMKAKISVVPVSEGIEIENNVSITANRRNQYFEFITDSIENKITVNGRIFQKSRTQYRSLSVTRPDIYALQVFKAKLIENGLKIYGDIDYKNLDDETFFMNQYEYLFSHHSLPAIEVINEINKNSNNFMANQIFLTLGDQLQSTWQAEQIIRQWLNDYKVNAQNLKMFDGSGLSPYNLCSAEILTAILQIMYNREDFKDFFNSLAITGVDGTLEYQFKYSLLRSEVYAKTGTISGVRSLSGYTFTKDREPIAFSIILNKADNKMSFSSSLIERILTEIVLFSRNQELFVSVN